MKLVRFTTGDGTARLGATDGQGVSDLTDILQFPAGDMLALIEGWPKVRAKIEAAANYDLPLARVRLLAPIGRPGKLFGIGLNYVEHAAEGGIDLPKEQMWFAMPASTANGPYDDVEKPLVSDALDYEAELVIVIGKRCRHVAAEHAADVIFGYCVGNDVSVRDWQLKTSQVTLGKIFDGHAPFGPWITTADAFDPSDAAISSWVNGERRQHSNTGNMVFNPAAQIALLSQAMTLEPGDLLFTGTPSGVGALMKPPSYMKVGDVVRCEIEGLGAIENPIVAERSAFAMAAQQ